VLVDYLSEGQTVDVILYTRPNCSLCEQAKATLADFQNRFPYYLIEVDITTDEAAYALYRFRIPVFRIGDQEVEAPISAEKLLAALERTGDS